MHVETPQGTWIIPPERAVWIPAQMPHRLDLYKVKTCSLYIDPACCSQLAAYCEVLAVSPLLRQLLLRAPQLNPPFDEHAELIFDLICAELVCAAKIDLHLPMPSDPQMLAICQKFLQAPDIHLAPEQLAAQLHVSERHFSRRFKRQVGISFSQWRQQACVLLSLEKLMQQQSIQHIAYDFGFRQPAAFSAMFVRILGHPPSRYLDQP
jgi:AraC-like DNA-binding protein